MGRKHGTLAKAGKVFLFLTQGKKINSKSRQIRKTKENC